MPAFERVGEFGCVVTAETGATIGDFYAIHMITDTVFAAMSANRMKWDTAIGSITFQAGMVLYVGDCTSFTLASGSVVAYRNG